MVRKYTTISVSKGNYEIAKKILEENRKNLEKINVKSVSDLYEQAMLILKLLLEWDLVEAKEEADLKFRLKK